MSGDPRCLVCRGSGFRPGSDEPCDCKPFMPRNADNQTLADIMAVGMRRAAETESHRQSCDARPCARCERFTCRCGTPFDGARPDASCDACRAKAKFVAALGKLRDAVPDRFHWCLTQEPDVDLVGARVKASPELVRRALERPPTGDMMLVGDTSAGKTSLAVAMLVAWVRQDPDARAAARFAESWWLAGAAARHPLGQGEAPDITAAKRAPLLVIDDLGSEIDDRRGVIAEVVFQRHNKTLPMWVTTGFDTDYLVGRYGSQVVRRIIELGKLVKLGGGK